MLLEEKDNTIFGPVSLAVLIMLLWFFALFEPYGLRLRHVIMGHYRPERAKTRAVWLYNHILRTRGSFMKLARRKLHREYKYSDQECLTFRHWINSLIPCWWMRYMFGTLPMEPHCLLCNTLEEANDSDTKLISCKTAKCPGVYCTRCYCDIGYLCTICLSPKDYGDMSDISLETGSSDESSDEESDDARGHDTNEMLKSSKADDDERERLLKKSNTTKKSKWKTAQREDNNQPQDQVSLLLSNAEKNNEIKNNRNEIVNLHNHKRNILLIYGIVNTRNVIYKEEIEYNWNFKINCKNYNHNSIHCKKKVIHNIFLNHRDWYYSKKYKITYDKTASEIRMKSELNIRKIRQNKLPRKINSKRNKGHVSFKTLLDKITFFYRFKIFRRSKLFRCMCKLNFYNIKITAKSFHVSKITKHSTQINKLKANYYKSYKLTNKSKRKYMSQTANNKTLSLAARIYRSCKNKDKKCNNKRDDKEKNTLSNNAGSNKINNNNDESADKKVSKKKFKNTKQHKKKSKSKRSSNITQKILSLCWPYFKSDDTFSKSILKECCCCLINKTNFKRRKKMTESNKTEKLSKNHIAKEEKVNAQNYRLSSYLSDQSYVWPKFYNDPENVRMKRVGVSHNLTKLVDHHFKEARSLLSIFKKGIKKKKQCPCPSNICICNQNFNKKSNKSQVIFKKKISDIPEKRPTEKSICSVKSVFKTDKKKKTPSNDRESFLKECFATESPEAKRLKFFTSMGNQDFKAFDENPETAACPEEPNKINLSTASIASNFACSSKTKTSKSGYSWNFDKDWISTTMKLMNIKDIKLALSEHFLYLRIKNPLPILKDLYTSLQEASTKMMKRKKENLQKRTDEKAVTVVPVVKSCSCQHLDVKPVREYQFTQIDKKLDENTTQLVPKHNRGKTPNLAPLRQTQLTANIEEYSSDITKSSVTLSTISMSEETMTDTTICSRLTIDYEVTPRRPKPQNNVRQIKIKVITKANQATSTDKARLCDVSTITSDWWSPIVERKLGKINLGRGEMYENRRQKNRSYNDKFTDGKIVTFKSRAQIIPADIGDILSPSRYLLESQKYYNELFSPKFKPVNVKVSNDFDVLWSSKDNTRKGRKTKRLNKRPSPRLKVKCYKKLYRSSVKNE